MKWVTLKTLLLSGMILLIFSNPVLADRTAETIEVFKKSAQVRPFFDHAYGYAVFPTIGKAGFVIGGAYGNGRVYRQGQVTGTANLAKVSLGFQLGGQAFSEIIFFKDQKDNT